MVLDEIVNLLETAEVGTFNQNIFISTISKPPAIDEPTLTLTEGNGGNARDRQTHNAAAEGKIAYETPNVQFFFRGKDYLITREMCVTCIALMATVQSRFVSGVWWVSTTLLQNTPVDLGTDGIGRATFSFNVAIEKRPSSVVAVPEWKETEW